MTEYLRLVAGGQVQLGAILEKEYPLEEATQAYTDLQAAADKPLAVMLRYPMDGAELQAVKLTTKVTLNRRAVTGKIRLAVVGAGGFAKGMHLPNLQRLGAMYHIRAIVSGTGSNAKGTALQYNADYATSNYEDVLNDPEVDAVLLATRHNLHASQAMAAARAGKAIFLEKPMALNQHELDELVAVLEKHAVPFMMGFNRRFSPPAQRIHQALQGRQSPLQMLYRVNAGYLPLDHWTQGPEGGGRMIGEGCHMLDLFQFLVAGAEPVAVTASAVQSQLEHIAGADNVSVTVHYADGSLGTLLYTALGSPAFSKEYLEVYGDQKVFVLDDYKTLRAYGAGAVDWNSPLADKGHVAELQSFARYVRGEIPAPIPLVEAVATTALTLQIAQETDKQLRSMS
jgi:predicted dehydrogenase